MSDYDYGVNEKAMRYCKWCGKSWRNADAWIDDVKSPSDCKCEATCSSHEEVPEGCLWVSVQEEELV